ncbi:MAG: HAD family phosphatase [Chloroflexi bacterium]|nr:HAD family phosphatase [Chloroflexota bacterium]
MRIDLVTFDLGNVLTLVDETRPIREFARVSGRSEADVVAACYAQPPREVLERGHESWPQFVDKVQKALAMRIPEVHFREIFNSALTPNKEIFELVDRVAASHRIALCSNTSPSHWELERGRLPFAAKFNPAIVSYEVGAMKPQREIYDALSERSRVPHGQILFIDDVLANVEGARKAGLNSVQFTGIDRLRADLKSFGIVV